MNPAAQLAAAVAVRKRASALLLGQRDRVRLKEELSNHASRGNSVAVPAAKQFKHAVAMLDDSRVFLGRDFDVVVGAAGFGSGRSIDARAGARVAAKAGF